MRPEVRYPLLSLAVLLLISAAAAAATPAYTTTYTITVQDDGSAIWQIEYRTLLVTADDSAAFDAYTRDLPSVYLPQVQDLMQRSAAQASVAATRPMAVSNVTGNAAIQTSPTGRYGVVVYSFSWSGFAEPDGTLTVGDAFAGGLYLEKDNTFILRYPSGWSVAAVDPAPDNQRDGLVWYGLRSFSPGEPRVVLERPAFMLVPFATVLIIVVIAGAGFFLYRRRTIPAPENGEPPGSGEPAAEALPAWEEEALGQRILALLESAGGEQYQAEMVKSLGLPKSTVSSSIAGLHAQGLVVKVRKGRENLIRLVRPGGSSERRG